MQSAVLISSQVAQHPLWKPGIIQTSNGSNSICKTVRANSEASLVDTAQCKNKTSKHQPTKLNTSKS